MYFPPILRLFFTGLGLSLLTASVNAEQEASRYYFIDEPVFQGRAYIVEAGNPQKPLLIFVHGLGDRAAETWRRFISILSNDFHVVSFDLPGFGHSSKANKLYSPDNYVQFIQYVARRYKQKSFMLVGHSMGGNIALRYAATYPEDLDRLMLIDAAGILHRFSYVKFLNHYGIKILPQFYKEQTQDLESVSDFLLGPLGENAGLIELGEKLILGQPALRENLLGAEPAAIAAYAMIMTDYSRVLTAMKVPTLILWGGQDAVTPLRTAKVLASALPNSGLIVFDSAGHSLMDEEPARFIDVLRQFSSLDKIRFNNMLMQHRYTRVKHSSASSSQDIDCQQRSVDKIEGNYKEITIRNCHDILLHKISANKVRLFHSKVAIENCDIENSNEVALENIDSDALITVCTIKGKPAVTIKNSNLDLAGIQLVSETQVIKNIGNKLDETGNIVGGGKLLFSVSKINSEYLEKYLHGPLLIRPGEGL